MALSTGKNGSKSINDAMATDKGSVDAITATVAALPAASANTGKIRYVGNGASGQPCLAYSNGTSWLRITLGAAVSAS